MRPDHRNVNSTAQAVWFVTLCLGFGYWLGALGRSGIAFHDLADLPTALLIPWKGACTFGLAAAVALSRRDTAGWRLALSLSISAIADMILATGAFVVSGVLFSTSHLIAISVFWANQASGVSPVRRTAVAAFPLLTFGLSVAALYGTGQPMFMALYPLLSGIMAATALLSRFPPWLCGLGAIVFVCSDVLVLAWLGIFERSNTLNFITWLTYFSGYAMIARGVMISRNSSD